MAYSKKIVAFIDLLGFKEFNLNSDEKESIHEVITTTETLLNIINNYNSNKKQNNRTGCVIRSFSDSIFFSYPYKNYNILFDDISTIAFEIAKSGFFFRGGITYGDIYDTGFTLYGPALIKAYNLENTTAYYPRIIIDHNSFENHNNNIIEKMKDNKNYFLQDFDNTFFVNFLSTQGISNKSDLELIKTHITNNIEKYKVNFRILHKYLWLANYFNKHLSNLNENVYDNCIIDIEPIDMNSILKIL